MYTKINLRNIIDSIMNLFSYNYKNKWFKVKNFTYNGFYGKERPGFTYYRARFNSWTRDPGVAKWDCSDGKARTIPTFAIDGIIYKKLPKQTYPNGIAYFGSSCES